jgi:hypothetical protein
MNQELQDKLFEKYPTLFENKNKSIQESCMAWGIECNNGWYELLSSVCWRISQHEKNIADPYYIPVKFDQIKEKFGGIRIYYTGGDDYVRGVVSLADEMSYKLCEVCGNAGKPNKGGWISVLCDEHRKLTQ